MATLLVACLWARPGSSQTLCTVTLNSADEKAALRAAFPRARLVELTDYAEPGSVGSDWLGASCRAGVSCDLLLVSGHFANTFFGESRLDLPLQTLERQTCGGGCQSVLERPPLVFLFGCNTLATKARDHRTPEQYRRVLLEDRLDPTFAERVVALRYSPLGPETRERMRRVFGNAALVFGFSSVGPVGAAAKPRFERFLRATRATLEATMADARSALRSGAALSREWRRAFGGLQPMVVHGADPPGEEECAFMRADQPRVDRLQHAARLLAADPLRYAPIVWDGLRGERDWQPAEREVLRRIGDDPRGRRDVMTALPRLTATLDSYFSLIDLAQVVGWLDEDEATRARATRLDAILAGSISDQERDFLCSQALTYAPAPGVLTAKRGNLRFLEALPCVSRPTPDVRGHLLAELHSPRAAVRASALDALIQLRLLVPSDVPALLQRFHGASGQLRASLLWALGLADGRGPATQRVIAGALADPDPDVAWAAVRVLQSADSLGPEALNALAAALDRREGFLRRSVAVALASLAPPDAQVLSALERYRDDADPVVRRSVAEVFAAAHGRATAAGIVASGQ